MTLSDLLRRVDLTKDKDKMLIYKFPDDIGWDNVDVKITNTTIEILPDKSGSPFSSDR